MTTIDLTARALAALEAGDPAAAFALVEHATDPDARVIAAIAIAALGRPADALAIARAVLAESLGHAGALAVIEHVEGAVVPDTARFASWDIGTVVDDRWEVFGSAAGGMGGIRFVKDRALGNMELAVKTLAIPSGLAPERVEVMRQLFRRETQIWLDLGAHPQIVTGFYTLDVAGALRFFMEYVPGRTLESWIGQLHLDQSIDFAIQIAAAMTYVHGRGTMHRDLKPANCLVARADGTLKVTDFGLGKQTMHLDPSAPAPASSPSGLSIAAIGTPAYMAPEQWRSLSAAGPPADVYALGIILFELVTQRHPGGDLEERERLEAPGAPGLAELVARCLARDPDARPTMPAIRDALLDIHGTLTRARYPRSLPDALATTAESESNRAASYAIMGERTRALEILDGVLATQPRALYAWLNRRAIEIDAGTREPATIYDELQDVLAANPGATSDPEVQRFRSRLAEHVVELQFDRRSPGREVAPRPLAYSPDGRHVAIAAAREVVLVESRTGATTRHRYEQLVPVNVTFADDGASLYVTLANDADKERREAAHAWDRLAVPDLAVLAGSRDGTAKLLAIRGDGTHLVRESSYPDDPLVVERDGSRIVLGKAQWSDAGLFARDRRYAATYGMHTVELWDLADGVRLEYFRLPVGGRFANVFEYERVDLARLANALPYGSRDEADVVFASDRTHVVTACRRGVEVWQLGREGAASTSVRHAWTDASTHVAIAPDDDQLAVIVGGRDVPGEHFREHATLRFAGMFAPRPSRPWGVCIHRALDAGTRSARREQAEHLVALLEAGDLVGLARNERGRPGGENNIAELATLRATTPELRDDFVLARRIHRATAPYGIAKRVTGRFVRAFPGKRVGHVFFDRSGERVFVEGADATVRIYDVATSRCIRELPMYERGAPPDPKRELVAVGNDDRTLLLRERDPATQQRYSFVATCVDVETGTISHVARCTDVAIHPRRDEVVVDTGSKLNVHATDGRFVRDLWLTSAGRPKFVADGALLRVIVHDQVEVRWYDDLAEVASTAREELVMGGRSDPQPSLDGRFADRRTRTAIAQDGSGRRLHRAQLEGRIASISYEGDRELAVLTPYTFAAIPSPIQLGQAAVGDFCDDNGLVALVRGDRVEIWMIEYECEFLEDVITAWAESPLPAELDACLDRWAELKRIAARPRTSASAIGRVAEWYRALVEHLRTLDLPIVDIARRARLVDPELAAELHDRTASASDATLIVHVGREHTAFPLAKSTVYKIGRHPDCEIQILDRLLSKEHCMIFWEADHWRIRDLGAISGTQLNGARLVGDRVLAHGDRVQIGQTELELSLS